EQKQAELAIEVKTASILNEISNVQSSEDMFDIDATLVLSWNPNNLTHKKSSYEVIN
ncbi:MAG: hypothetical protein HOI17_02135, partial [Alphaproteobacteria bacterium]|nr:hypothetical protein [Alphaproteobacteria bacterium]